MLKYQVHGERKRNQHEEPCNHSSPYGRGVLCHRRHYEPNIDHHGRIALLRTRMLSKPISIIQHHLPWTSRHLTAMRPNNTDRKLAFNSNQREQTSRDPHVESGICNEVKSATSWTCDFFPTEWSFIHWALKKSNTNDPSNPTEFIYFFYRRVQLHCDHLFDQTPPDGVATDKN
jgi:hypothetical protein